MGLEGKSTRRGFLKQAGLVTGGAALASSVFGVIGADPAAASPVAWDQTADVVVVGGGGAGLAAAVEAARAGASVIVLEKAATTGGSTTLSGGVIQAAGTPQQKQFTKYQDDTPEKHYQTWLLEGEGMVEEDLIKDHTYAMPAHIEWLESLGLEFDAVYGHCHVPYFDNAGVFADRIHVYKGGGAIGGGGPMVAAMETAAVAAGAVIQLSVEVLSLVADGANGVVGVMAHGPSGDFSVGANKGVVIATSSIDHNKEMAKALNAQQYWDITTQSIYTVPTATGDGIRMGQQIGAALAGFGGTIDFDPVTGMGTDNRSPQIAFVYVNGRGQRFVCEDATYAYVYRAIFQQNMMHKAATYMILDAKGVQGKASPWAGDKLAAAVKSGQLIKAKSLTELAQKIKVPAVNLRHTLADWNSNITRYGKDREYRRNTQLVNINKAPYYAYKTLSGNLGAIGGLKIDVNAQVIDVNGDPIPHLFAAGMASGGWIGQYYPGSGTAISGVIHWGRKAGVSAAGA
jgi:fumarate reductase flavoprotein subunit